MNDFEKASLDDEHYDGSDCEKLNKKVGALNCMHDEQALMIQRRQEMTEEPEYYDPCTGTGQIFSLD